MWGGSRSHLGNLKDYSVTEKRSLEIEREGKILFRKRTSSVGSESKKNRSCL